MASLDMWPKNVNARGFIFCCSMSSVAKALTLNSSLHLAKDLNVEYNY